MDGNKQFIKKQNGIKKPMYICKHIMKRKFYLKLHKEPEPKDEKRTGYSLARSGL